jgi:hypothetical protein
VAAGSTTQHAGTHGSAAQEHAQRNFSATRLIRDTEAFYEQVADETGVRR